MYTLGELKNNIAVLVQRSGSSDYKGEIETWINLSLQTLYNEYDYWNELINIFNFTTVDGTSRYYMPSDFEKPLRMFDITNNKPITPRTYQEYFDSNIGNIADANEASAAQYYFTEVVGVKVQVATTGDTVKAKSSSASDTTQIARVEGYLDSSLTIVGYENISLNGITAVAGSTTFYKILHVAVSADTAGYTTLTDSSDTTLTTIGQIARVSRHKAFDLGLIPDDSTTSMRVLYKKRFPKLVDDNDYPFVECDNYLIFNSASLAMQQEKELLDRAVLMANQAKAAKDSIMLNQATKLGTAFQHKLVSPIMQSHRA